MPSAPAKTENAGRGARLDSWKEIAAYLGKAERTVKRWEKERGLPTHRLPGSGNASVYAYTAELDQWLKSGTAPEPQGSPVYDAGPRQDQLLIPATRETEPNPKAAPTYPKPESLLPPVSGGAGCWHFAGSCSQALSAQPSIHQLFGQAASV
jgi:predicted DNA-binding transcriptional regulator AlpA